MIAQDLTNAGPLVRADVGRIREASRDVQRRPTRAGVQGLGVAVIASPQTVQNVVTYPVMLDVPKDSSSSPATATSSCRSTCANVLRAGRGPALGLIPRRHRGDKGGTRRRPRHGSTAASGLRRLGWSRRRRRRARRRPARGPGVRGPGGPGGGGRGPGGAGAAAGGVRARALGRGARREGQAQGRPCGRRSRTAT